MKFVKTGAFGSYFNADFIETIEAIKDDKIN